MLTKRADGFTLPELLIVLALFGIVLGGTISMLVRQQQFYRSAGQISQVRDQLLQAIGAMSTDLRAISPLDGDLYAINDNSVEFRAVTGSTIICQISSATQFLIPPLQLANGNTLTVWSTAPVAGDSLFVYDDSTAVGLISWKALSISSITPVTGSSGCQPASGFVQAADLSQPSYRITVPAARGLPPTIINGAPIRFFRRVHYELYQASDNGWYLGWFDCLAGRSPACNALQPLAGPYRPYSSAAPGTSGLLFSYYDSTGAALTASAANRSRVTRVKISVRGQAQQVSVTGTPAAAYNDSLVMDVGVRNQQ